VPIEAFDLAAGEPRLTMSREQFLRCAEAEYLEARLVSGHGTPDGPAMLELGMGMARGLERPPRPEYVTAMVRNVPPGGVELVHGEHVGGHHGMLGVLVGVEVDGSTRRVVGLLLRIHHGLRHHVVCAPAPPAIRPDGELHLDMTFRQIWSLPRIPDPRHGLAHGG
jgi:hypothetical protein